MLNYFVRPIPFRENACAGVGLLSEAIYKTFLEAQELAKPHLVRIIWCRLNLIVYLYYSILASVYCVQSYKGRYDRKLFINNHIHCSFAKLSSVQKVSVYKYSKCKAQTHPLGNGLLLKKNNSQEKFFKKCSSIAGPAARTQPQSL